MRRKYLIMKIMKINLYISWKLHHKLQMNSHHIKDTCFAFANIRTCSVAEIFKVADWQLS